MLIVIVNIRVSMLQTYFPYGDK